MNEQLGGGQYGDGAHLDFGGDCLLSGLRRAYSSSFSPSSSPGSVAAVIAAVLLVAGGSPPSSFP